MEISVIKLSDSRTKQLGRKLISQMGKGARLNMLIGGNGHGIELAPKA